MTQSYTVTLQPLADERPPEIRLRILLKHALRDLQLKCVDLKAKEQQPVKRY
jgi:hypothetical protein